MLTGGGGGGDDSLDDDRPPPDPGEDPDLADIEWSGDEEPDGRLSHDEVGPSGRLIPKGDGEEPGEFIKSWPRKRSNTGKGMGRFT